MNRDTLPPCTCVMNGIVHACARHDTIIFHECREPAPTTRRTAFDADNYGTVGRWDAVPVPVPARAATSVNYDDVRQAVEKAYNEAVFPQNSTPAPAGRILQGEAHFVPAKTAPAVPFSGPLGDLLSLTHRIDTQPTHEQWQTLKTLILRLERT